MFNLFLLTVISLVNQKIIIITCVSKFLGSYKIQYHYLLFHFSIDIILDHKLKPWLLEVNHTPSFTADTPLDKVMKRAVIRDALTLMNVNANNKIKYKNQKKIELQQRVLTGKKTRLTLEEKQICIEKAQKERDEWEAKNCGSYEKIYPFDVNFKVI